MSYTTDDKGELGGLPGYTRILKDGQPILYYAEEDDALDWIREHSERAPYCTDCGAISKKYCHCPPRAENN